MKKIDQYRELLAQVIRHSESPLPQLPGAAEPWRKLRRKAVKEAGGIRQFKRNTRKDAKP